MHTYKWFLGREMWNSNQFQAKVLEFIQLHAFKYILGCCVTTCDELEPMRVNVGFKTLRNWRDLCRLKWYCKVMSMKDERPPFKLLTND